MSDYIIVGILGIAAAILGTFSGVAISKILDRITAKRERKRYQILLRFKLAFITTMIKNIISQVNSCEKIADDEDFIIIEDMLQRNDIKEEISKLESLTEKATKFNFDEEENEYLTKFIHLKFGINYLLYCREIHAKEPKPDEKPDLLKLLTGISNDLEFLSRYYSQEKKSPRKFLEKMEPKNCARVSLILIFFGFIGLLIFEWDTFISQDIYVKLLGNSVLYLALLSMAIFYLGNSTKLVRFTHKPWIGHLGILLLMGSFVGFGVIEVISLWAGNGIYPAPLFMAALAIGFFFTNQAMKSIVE